MMNLPLDLASLLRHAAREPRRSGIVTVSLEGASQLSSWGQLEQRARRWGQLWQRLGVAPGGVVAVLGQRAQRLVEAVLGTAASGVAVLTLNPRHFPEEWIHAANLSRAQALLFDPDMAPLVEAMQLQLLHVGHYVQFGGPERLPQGQFGSPWMDAETLLAAHDPDWDWPMVEETQVAMIGFTPTSSGLPRGVPVTHRAAVLQALSAVMPDAYGLRQHDVVMPLLPLSHSGAWALCLSAALVRASLVLVPPGCEPERLVQVMAEQGVSLAAGPPNVWLQLLDHLEAHAVQLPHLRQAVVGAAAFPPALLERLQALPGCEVLHTWGMSEIAPPALVARGAVLRPDAMGRLPQGRPVFGVELALIDEAGCAVPHDGISEGLLVARGPWVLQAYLGEAQSPLVTVDGEGAWLPTGDIARMDPEGIVTLTDRRKDLIRCGDEWISAQWLERIALGCPGVAQAAVVARKDPVLGETPFLVVTARPGEVAPDTDAVLASFEGRVPDWQRPQGALVFPELPRLGSGEVDKRELLALIETVLD